MSVYPIQPFGITGYSGTPTNNSSRKSDSITLFEFSQRNRRIALILREKQEYFRERTRSKDFRGSTSRKETEFILLGPTFENDFEIMSKLLAVMTVAERSATARGYSVAKMSHMVSPAGLLHHQLYLTEDYHKFKGPVDCAVFANTMNFKSGSHGLNIGFDVFGTKFGLDLTIPWVHHLKQSLQKAMNWLKPWPEVSFTEG